MLDNALKLRNLPPYKIRSLADVATSLNAFLRSTHLNNPVVTGLKRMGGGASKEQFVFDLAESGKPSLRCVLRMDPLESAVVTSRERESAILNIMQDVLPAPMALWCDADGSQLGRPALITNFVSGVTKPSVSTSNVSGFGTAFDQSTREALTVPFLKHLVAMHKVDWRTHAGDTFQAPLADPQQAARWQLNWWTRVWHDDVREGYPLMGLAERWMRENLPSIAPGELVFVHSDYRTGNFLYDEATRDITSILDWELIHVGDFHEDLAWAAISTWSTVENGTLLASGLLPGKRP
jgi:aminoglycoside phosphotransferase (APT) family kinase protein